MLNKTVASGASIQKESDEFLALRKNTLDKFKVSPRRDDLVKGAQRVNAITSDGS